MAQRYLSLPVAVAKAMVMAMSMTMATVIATVTATATAMVMTTGMVMVMVMAMVGPRNWFLDTFTRVPRVGFEPKTFGLKTEVRCICKVELTATHPW